MRQDVLKKAILDRIKTDPMLYGKVAAELAISPASLPRLIYDNDKKLTQAGVLRVLRDHLNSSNDDLLETVLWQKEKGTQSN